MKTRSTTIRRLGILSVVSVILAILIVTGVINSENNRLKTARANQAEDANSPVTFDDGGRLIRPTGYRKWNYVGTPVTPNDMNGGSAPFPEFHTVYMNPEAFDHYEKTGEFLDGTVLVKELISVGTKEASSGAGYFMGEFIGLEVSMKSKARFENEPGNWAYFSFGHKYPLRESANAQPTVSCNECHDGSADDDFVFTQYYPVLRAFKKEAE